MLKFTPELPNLFLELVQKNYKNQQETLKAFTSQIILPVLPEGVNRPM